VESELSMERPTRCSKLTAKTKIHDQLNRRQMTSWYVETKPLTERPSRCSKLSAKTKIRDQLKSDEETSTDEDSSSVQSEGSDDEKLNLEAYVLLERISVADCNVSMVAGGSSIRDSGNGSCQQNVDITRGKSLASMNEDTLFTMWDLRHSVVRLERIDVEKTLQELKSKAIITK
jgi:hypothetical protein